MSSVGNQLPLIDSRSGSTPSGEASGTQSDESSRVTSSALPAITSGRSSPEKTLLRRTASSESRLGNFQSTSLQDIRKPNPNEVERQLESRILTSLTPKMTQFVKNGTVPMGDLYPSLQEEKNERLAKLKIEPRPIEQLELPRFELPREAVSRSCSTSGDSSPTESFSIQKRVTPPSLPRLLSRTQSFNTNPE